MRLHDYWRSGASYRVRIALNLKGLTYDQVSHDLRTGAQRAADYATLNPQMLVPALELDDGTVIPQSPAILEWLEEMHPTPPLLPASPADRATVRAMTALIACDIHPLNNLRVLRELKAMGHDQPRIDAWAARWIGDGFAALETLVARHGGTFAFGDTPTFVDCCLVPQFYSADRFGVPLDAYPRLGAVVTAARELPAVAAAHPGRQPDADPA